MQGNLPPEDPTTQSRSASEASASEGIQAEGLTHARQPHDLAWDKYTMSNIKVRLRMRLRTVFQCRGIFLDVKISSRSVASRELSDAACGCPETGQRELALCAGRRFPSGLDRTFGGKRIVQLAIA
jgi:hypothetical protein